MPVKILVKNREPMSNALRRFKKALLRVGVMREVANRAHYVKPSEQRRRQEKRRQQNLKKS